MKFLQNGQEENGSKMVIIRLTISGNLWGEWLQRKKGPPIARQPHCFNPTGSGWQELNIRQ
jgi:hypothetical protein